MNVRCGSRRRRREQGRVVHAGPGGKQELERFRLHVCEKQTRMQQTKDKSRYFRYARRERGFARRVSRPPQVSHTGGSVRFKRKKNT